MSEPTLKPCPFCSGKAIAMPPTLSKRDLGSDPKARPGRFYSVVFCATPDCYAEMAGPDHDDSCRVVIAAWNRRAEPQE